MESSRKVIVIGLDGADKALMLEWAAAGILPNIRALLERSTWCDVANPPGLFAGSICPSFYTGLSPARHGKFCSHQMKSGTYEFRRVQGFDPRCATLWDVLGEQGRRVAVIDAPKSRVTKDLNGVQVVDWAAEDFAIDLGTWPPELAEALERDYGRNEIVEIAAAAEGYAGFGKLRDRLLARLRNKTRMSARILAQEDWDFFFTLLTEVHSIGHLCWHLHDETHPLFDAAEAQRIGDVVRDVYVATDAALEEFVAMADARTHVFVYSINGMGASHTGNHILDDVLLAADRQALPPLRRRLAGAADWIERMTPQRLHAATWPAQRALRRSLAIPVRDLPFRTAFRVPSNTVAGGVRINLAGREPNGCVPPGDFDEVCAGLQALMSSLVDAQTGDALSKRVIATRDVYAGPHLDELPDLLVEWTQDAPISRVWSPATGEVRRQYGGHRTGDHRPEGVLFSLNGAAGRGQVDAISVYDLAPTIAGMLAAGFPECDGADVSVRLGVEAGQ